MNNNEDAPRSNHGLAAFARRLGEAVTKGLTLSGQAELTRWTPVSEARQPLNGVDRSDVRLMAGNRRFTPADLETAIRRAGSGSSER